MKPTCSHLDHATRRDRGVHPSGEGCAECLAGGTAWVHLRLCLSCGHVGCCDSSPGRHATAHHRATAHPVVRSYEPDEAWGYCYLDDAFAPAVPALGDEAAPRHFAPR